MNEDIVTRYTAPTKYDYGLYGQICRVEGESDHHYYIQVSKAEGENKWMPMGEFLEKTWRHKFYNFNWIQEMLQNLEI